MCARPAPATHGTRVHAAIGRNAQLFLRADCPYYVPPPDTVRITARCHHIATALVLVAAVCSSQKSKFFL